MDLFHQLFLLLQVQFSVLADGFIVLLTVILDDHAFIFLIFSELIPNFLSFLFLPFLDLSDSFLPALDLLLLGDMLAVGECVRLEEVEFVACGHEGELVECFDGFRLAGLELGQLVEGPPRLLDLGLQIGEVLELELKV